MTIADPVLGQIPEFLKSRPTKEQLHDFLGQLANAHPEEVPKLIGVALWLEIANYLNGYSPHEREQIAAGAERLLKELEPFGNHPEDYFTPLLNKGWIKGETLIDKENPPNVADLVRLKCMLDRDAARHQKPERAVETEQLPATAPETEATEQTRATTPEDKAEIQKNPVRWALRQLHKNGRLPKHKNGTVNRRQAAGAVASLLADLPAKVRSRTYKENSGQLRTRIADELEALSIP